MTRAILAALGAVLALAACGGGSGGGTASTGPNADRASADSRVQDAALRFTRCMRDHGVDVPDPKAGSGGFLIGGPSSKIDPEDPAFQAAQKACGHFLADARPKLTADQRQKAQEQGLKFARCMREHGIDFPDSAVSGDGAVRIQRGQIDPTDPRFQAAQKACGSPFGTGTR
jgi:hypothetical protein